MLMLGIGVVLFSLGPVLVAASSASGAVLSLWRLGIGAALLGAVTLWRGRMGGLRVTRRGWQCTAAAGLAFGAHQLFFMIAIKATSVVDVTLMQVIQPIVVGVFALLLFGERPGVTFRLWSVVAAIGAALVILAGTTGPRGDPAGMALAVANVVCFAVYFVSSKQAMVHIAALPFLFGVAVVAGLAVSLFAAVTGEEVQAISSDDLLIAAVIAVVPGGLGHFVSTHPLRKVAANIPPVMQLAMPFLSGGLAWLVLGQRISWLHFIGGLVTIAGVVGALISPGGRRLRNSPEGDETPSSPGAGPAG